MTGEMVVTTSSIGESSGPKSTTLETVELKDFLNALLKGNADWLSYVVVGILSVILLFGLYQCMCFCLQRCRDCCSLACCIMVLYSLVLFSLFILFLLVGFGQKG